MARPFDAISAGAGERTVLVAGAGLFVTLLSHNCDLATNAAATLRAHFPPKQGLEK
jgi:hypothetical protein